MAYSYDQIRSLQQAYNLDHIPSDTFARIMIKQTGNKEMWEAGLGTGFGKAVKGVFSAKDEAMRSTGLSDALAVWGGEMGMGPTARAALSMAPGALVDVGLASAAAAGAVAAAPVTAGSAGAAALATGVTGGVFGALAGGQYYKNTNSVPGALTMGIANAFAPAIGNMAGRGALNLAERMGMTVPISQGLTMAETMAGQLAPGARGVANEVATGLQGVPMATFMEGGQMLSKGAQNVMFAGDQIGSGLAMQAAEGVTAAVDAPWGEKLKAGFDATFDPESALLNAITQVGFAVPGLRKTLSSSPDAKFYNQYGKTLKDYMDTRYGDAPELTRSRTGDPAHFQLTEIGHKDVATLARERAVLDRQAAARASDTGFRGPLQPVDLNFYQEPFSVVAQTRQRSEKVPVFDSAETAPLHNRPEATTVLREAELLKPSEHASERASGLTPDQRLAILRSSSASTTLKLEVAAPVLKVPSTKVAETVTQHTQQTGTPDVSSEVLTRMAKKKAEREGLTPTEVKRLDMNEMLDRMQKREREDDPKRHVEEMKLISDKTKLMGDRAVKALDVWADWVEVGNREGGMPELSKRLGKLVRPESTWDSETNAGLWSVSGFDGGTPTVRQAGDPGKAHLFDAQEKADVWAEHMNTNEKDGRSWEVRETAKGSGKFQVVAKNKMLATMTDEIADRAAMPTDVGDPVEQLITVDAAKDLDAAFRMIAPLERLQGIGPFKALSETEFNQFMQTFANHVAQQGLNGEEMMKAVPQFLSDWTNKRVVEASVANMMELATPTFMTQTEKMFSPGEVEKLPKSKSGGLFYDLVKARFKGLPKVEQDLLPGFLDWVEATGKENGGQIRPEAIVEYAKANGPQVNVHTYGMDGKVNVVKEELDKLTHDWFDNLDQSVRNAVQLLGHRSVEDLAVPSQQLLTGVDMDKVVRFHELTKQLNDEPHEAGPKATNYYKTISPYDTDKYPVVRIDVSAPTKQLSDTQKLAKYKEDARAGKRGKFTASELAEIEGIQDWARIPERIAEDPYQKPDLWTPDNLHENLPNTLGWAMVQFVPGPDGRTVMFVGEQQSRWGQSVQKMGKRTEVKHENGRWNIYERGELTRDFATEAEATAELRRFGIPESHPLLDSQHNLVLKAAIDEARKRGVDQVVISDGTTAMMTEGHDKILSAQVWPDTPAVRERLTKGGIEFVVTSDGHLTPPPKQAKGMRLHYDTTLPSAMRALTGDKGREVVMPGVHKQADTATNDADAFLPIGSPVFRDPSGNPESRIVGQLFDVSKVTARRATGESFSFGGKNYMLVGDKAILTQEQLSVKQAAMRMDASGVDPKRVTLLTGWFKSAADGEWRFQTSDRYLEIRPDLRPRGKEDWMTMRELDELATKHGFDSPIVKEATERVNEQNMRPMSLPDGVTVEQFLVAPELLSMYPFLKDIPVKRLLDVKGQEYRGYYAEGSPDPAKGGLLALKENMPYGEFVDVLVHEVQHYIQGVENWARGGNSETKAAWLEFDVGRRLNETKEAKAIAEHQAKNKHVVQKHEQVVADYKAGRVPERTYKASMRTFKVFEDKLERLVDALETVRLSDKFTPKDPTSREGLAFYKKIAGEIEANLTSDRRMDDAADMKKAAALGTGMYALSNPKTFKGSLVYKGEESQSWGVMGSKIERTLLARIQSVFPESSVEPSVLKFNGGKSVEGFVVTLPNGKTLAVDASRDTIIFDVKYAAKSHEVKESRVVNALGKYRTGLIELLSDYSDGTLAHEKLHALMDLVYSDSEKASILRRFDGSEEKAAEAFRRAQGYTDGTFDKLKAFIERLRGFNFPTLGVTPKIAVENMLLHALEMNGHTSEQAKSWMRAVLQQFDHNDIKFGLLNDPKALGMQQTNPDGTMNVWAGVANNLMRDRHAFMFTMAHEVNGHGLIETFKLARERLAKDPKADIKSEFGLSREHFESVKNFYDMMDGETAESRGILVREFTSLLPVEARKAVEQLLVRPDATKHEEAMADMQATMSYLIASDYVNGRSTGRLAQLIELLPTPIAKMFTALAEWSRKFFSSLRTVQVGRAAHVVDGYVDPVKQGILNDYIDSLHSILRVDARNNKAAVEALRYSDFVTPGAIGLKLAGPEVNPFLRRNMMESPDVERAVQILGLMPDDGPAPKKVGFFRRHAGLVSTLSVLYPKFGGVTAEHSKNEHSRNTVMADVFAEIGLRRKGMSYLADKDSAPQVVENNVVLAAVRDDLMRLVQVRMKKSPGITVAQLVAAGDAEALGYLGKVSKQQQSLVLDAVFASEKAHGKLLGHMKTLQDDIAQGQYAILMKALDRGLTVEQAKQRVKQFHKAWEAGQLGVISTGYPDVDAAMIKYFERVRKIHEEWSERRGYISEQRSGDFRYQLHFKDGTKSMDSALSELQMKINIDAHKLNPALDKIVILGKEPRNIRFQRQDLEALAEVESEHMYLLKSSIEQLADAHPELTPEVIKIITGLVDKSSTVSAQLASVDANTLDVKSPKARRLAPGRENLDMFGQQIMFFERVVKGLTNKLTKVNYDLAMRDEDMINHPASEMMDQAMENLFKPDPEMTRVVQNMNWYKGLALNWFNMLQDASQPMTGLLRSVLVGKGVSVVDAERAIWRAGKDLLPGGKLTGERAAIVEWFKKGNVGLASTETPMNNDALMAIQERRRLMGYESSSLIKDNIVKPTFWLLQKSKDLAKIATDYGETTTMLASFDAFRKQGMNFEQAREAAFRNTKEVNSSSGKSGRSVTMWNAPALRPIAAMVNGLQNFSNGVIGILSAQLQRGFFSYGPNSTQFRKNLSNILGHTGELSKSERVQARKAFVIGMGTMLAVAGALGIPGVGIYLKTMEALGWNAKEDLMKALTDEEDPDNSTFNLIALHGLGNLLGFDVGAKMGVGGMLGLNPYNGFDAANLFGVTGGLIKSAGLSAVDLLHGNVGSAVERVAPNVLQRPLKLYRDGWEFRDADGTKMIESTDMERTMMSVFGVKPKRLMDMEELRRIQRADRDIRKQTNVMWVDEQATKLEGGDVQQVKEAIAERVSQDPTLEPDALMELIAQQYVDRTMPYNPALEPGARSPLMAMLPGGKGQGDNVERLQTANHVKLMLGGELPAYMRPKKPAGVRKSEEAQKRIEKNNLMMQMLGGAMPGYMGERIPTRGAQTTTPRNSLERATLFDQMLNANPRQSVDEISALLRQ